MLPRSDSPSHSDSFSQRDNSRHSFTSLWLTLMALDSLQLIFSGSCLLCNNQHPRLSAQSTAVTRHALCAPFTGTHCPTSKNNAIQGIDSLFFQGSSESFSPATMASFPSAYTHHHLVFFFFFLPVYILQGLPDS